MIGTVFRLGLWNPAGAKIHQYATATERDKARRQAQQNGYICWEVNDGHVG